jgi:hypothetical protein
MYYVLTVYTDYDHQLLSFTSAVDAMAYMDKVHANKERLEVVKTDMYEQAQIEEIDSTEDMKNKYVNSFDIEFDEVVV